jgi:hypothetical protein
MKYLPGAIPQNELDIIAAPYLGGEFAAYLSSVASVLLGTVTLSGASAGAWTADPAVTIKTGGADIAIVAKSAIQSTAAMVVTLNGLDNSSTPVACTITATFQPPTRALNQTFNFQRGWATDMAIGGITLPADTERARASNVATLTVPAHGLTSGQKVNITGVGGTGYNLAGVTVTVIDVNNFTYPSVGANETTAADTTGVITTAVGTKVTAITGLASVTNGGTNQILSVYQLPEAADWVLITPTTEIDFNDKSRQAKGIDSGLEADAFIKGGKTQQGTLSIGQKLTNYYDGCQRFVGSRCSALLVGIKDGVATGDRIVFTTVWGTTENKLPEGDGEAMADFKAKFVEGLYFFAP